MQDHGICYTENLPDNLVDAMVGFQSAGDGQNLGYRAMTTRLRNEFNVNVSRDAVASSQKRVNPEAVAQREKRKLTRREYFVEGPDALWHNDGMDKIIRFGFAIHA